MGLVTVIDVLGSCRPLSCPLLSSLLFSSLSFSHHQVSCKSRLQFRLSVHIRDATRRPGRGLLGSGSHYEGRVVNGLPEGHGCEVGPDGTVTEGFFKRGLLHGRGFILDPRGNCAEGEWEDGVLVGI